MNHVARVVCRAILFALAIFLSGSAAYAATSLQSGPDHFLISIYMRYYLPGSPEASPFATNETIRRYFEPVLAAALIGAEDGINVDPFVDAQDNFLKSISIHVDRTDAHRATTTVHIRNDSPVRPVRLRFKLVHLCTGWRIFDILSADDSFRAEYVKK